jgi:hypothetical protein
MFNRAICLMAVMLLATSTARAADDGGDDNAPKPHQGIMHGTVVRVDGTTLIFKAKKGPEVSVPTTDATVVTIDGNPAKLSDLTAGLLVQVLSTNDAADKIIAKTPNQ